MVIGVYAIVFQASLLVLILQVFLFTDFFKKKLIKANLGVGTWLLKKKKKTRRYPTGKYTNYDTLRRQ